MMKTAITVLQELMVKYTDTPKYECTAQSGPQHQAMFEYRCEARGHLVMASARSKKEAKQEAARLMLRKLAAAGLPVPPPYGSGGSPGAAAPPAGPEPAAAAVANPRSYKALLKELCEEYHLPAPVYTLEGDAGPAHARRFTARGAVGAHAHSHTAPTKKAAQQGAAQQLYQYLRENLARLTHDFVEEDALARAHERAMERYVEARGDAAWRPDLKQRVQDYHLDMEQLSLGSEALAATDGEAGAEPESALERVAAALGLAASWHELPAEAGAPLALLRLAPASPPLVFAGADRAAAAQEALAYLRLTMTFKGQQ